MLVVKIHLVSILMLLVALQYVAPKKSDPCSVDAAFTYGKNDKIYFFKGDKYAYYNDDDAKNRGLSELYPISWWKGVPNNIDAAFRYSDDIYYFFKGCDIYAWDHRKDKVTSKVSIESWKAPCNIDSAFKWGSNVYLLKGNEYWEWHVNAAWKWRYLGGNKNIKNYFGVEGPFDAVVQWRENGRIYFFKGEYYWRLVNGLLGKVTSIAAWKGLVDSGVQLLKDCPCSCTRLGHKENWKMKKIDYDVDNSNVIELKQDIVKRKTIDLLNVDKCFSECPTISYTVTKTLTETRRFESTTGIGMSIGTTMKTGLPGLVNGEVKIEASLQQDFTYGKDNTVSVVKTDSFVCPGFPKKYATCLVLVKKRRVEVPYTMTFKHKTQGCTCEEKGTYKSLIPSNFVFKATHCDTRSSKC